jgi:hypothetical protein
MQTAGLISDAATYMKLVEAMIQHVDCAEPHVMSALSDSGLLSVKAAPPMSTQDCVGLQQYATEQTGSVLIMLLKLPAAKALPPEPLYCLMQLCMHGRPPQPLTPNNTPNTDADKEDTAQPPCLHALSNLARLPAARQLSVRQVADIISCFMRQEGKLDIQGLSSLLALPAVENFEWEVAQGLVSAAATAGSWDAINMLCQRSPACAVAWEDFDSQLLVQRMHALLQGASPDTLCLRPELFVLLKHQVLPKLLLTAFAQGCSSKGCEEGRASLTDVRTFLQLPAAAVSLSVSVMKELMQHSILQLGGALLPELVRLPAAAQLQQECVAALLQAALRRTSTSTGRGSSNLGTAVTHTAPAAAAAAGVLSAPTELQRQGQLEATSKQGPAHVLMQQQQQEQEALCAEQEQASNVHGSPAGSNNFDIHGLLQQCLQCCAATPHMFQLLTLPWVRQLPMCVLKDLLVAAVDK